MRGLGLAYAVLKTAVRRSEVGVGLSEDSVKLARGIRRMGGQSGEGKLEGCVLLEGRLRFYIPAEWELVPGSRRANAVSRQLPDIINLP